MCARPRRCAQVYCIVTRGLYCIVTHTHICQSQKLAAKGKTKPTELFFSATTYAPYTESNRISQWVTSVMRRAAVLMGMDHTKAANLKVHPHLFRYILLAGGTAACHSIEVFVLSVPAHAYVFVFTPPCRHCVVEYVHQHKNAPYAVRASLARYA